MTDEFDDKWNRAQGIIKNHTNTQNMTEYERSDLVMRLAIHFNIGEEKNYNKPSVLKNSKPKDSEPEQDTDEYFETEKGRYPKRLKCKGCGKVLTADESKRDPGTYYYRCGSCQSYTYPTVSGEGR